MVTNASTAKLSSATSAFEAWPPRMRRQVDTLAGGLEATYRRGQRGMRRARRDTDEARMHEWRKGVKYLWYQMRLLEPTAPSMLSPMVDRLDDPVVRQELAALVTGERIRAWLPSRGLHPSIGKLWRTIQGRRAAQLAHVLGGPRATAWETDDVEADHYAYHVLNCRGMSLGGGTDEIQRNTLGERVLGLPREPGPDRDTPFRELLSNDG